MSQPKRRRAKPSTGKKPPARASRSFAATSRRSDARDADATQRRRTTRTKAKAKARSISSIQGPPAGSSGSAGGLSSTKRRSSQERSSQKTPPDRKPIRRSARGDQRSAAKAVKKKKRSPTKTSRPGARKSRHPEALRSRRRRRDQQGVRDQLRYEKAERKRVQREIQREKKAGLPPDPRRLAIGWLEEIRNIVAGIFPVSVDLTYAEAGAVTPWLVVGRFDALEPIGYTDLAGAFSLVRDDLMLEVAINPRRLSQIRIVYRDPRGHHHAEGDSIVSKTGAWEFILSDLLGELVGAGDDDEDALAVRYAETAIPRFYVYFSTQLIGPDNGAVWQKVMFR